MKISLIGSTLVVLLMVKLAIVSALETYWNIPSFMCKKYKMNFSNSVPRYGIQQNEDDNFRGETISILYDPGRFPALGTKNERRNGGVPQEGSIEEHLTQYRKDIDELVPNQNYSGLIVIDFESWRPILRQNTGDLTPYKDYSYEIERQRHPFWSKSRQQAEATKRFESAGKDFVEKTIQLSKELRPAAKWGYYAFPYCFNKATAIECPDEVKKENDRMNWMFRESNVLFPSVYLQDDKRTRERESLVVGRIKEAQRVSRKSKYIYIRNVYTNSLKQLSESDLLMVYETAQKAGASVVLWGSSNDLKTREKCEQLHKYLESTLGPIAQSYHSPRYFVDVIDNN